MSDFFHPCPKPESTKKVPKRIKKGKKTVEWDIDREALKKEFAAMGITQCEIGFEGKCWVSAGLSFAHVDKRRYLRPGEEKKVVLACIPCHMVVETWNRTKMRPFLEKIIEERSIII